MNATFESDVMDDLMYDEAEGLSDMGYADEFEDYDDFDGFDAYDEYDEYDEFDEYDDFLEYDEYDEFDEYDGEYLMDAMEDIVADALDAEDIDEFWGRIKKWAKKAKRIAKKVGRGIGKVSRIAAPILSKIPLPQAQAIGRIAGIAGKLLAEGADEFEGIDEIADYADYEDLDAAIPVVAGLTIRKTVPGIKYKPKSVRKKLVKAVSKATKKVVNRQGTKAAKAMPKVVQTAKKVSKRTGQPLTKAIAKTATKVSKSPTTTGKMALPVIKKAKTGLGKMGSCPTCGKKYTLRGPVTISIQGR